MKKILSTLSILTLLLLTGCGRDPEQAKRYSDMKSECDSLINQANLIINAQNALTDSLRKIRIDIIKVKTQKYSLPEIDKRITNAIEIESNTEKIKKHLEAIKGFSENGEKATDRLIYFKRKYITYATVIQVNNENIAIQEITNGLTAKQYISKYLQNLK